MTGQRDQDMWKISKQLYPILGSAELHGMVQNAGALTGLRTGLNLLGPLQRYLRFCHHEDLVINLSEKEKHWM